MENKTRSIKDMDLSYLISYPAKPSHNESHTESEEKQCLESLREENARLKEENAALTSQLRRLKACIKLKFLSQQVA